ncbi:2OG-Fe(II) oxygenase superfamily protein [Phytophthora cinnamomi]|uniref:2OG-Fe(II) oxygenase superfamily protein n=1 Tax=Phytophthora cinnamomi TaxID=4785 RepID=UPI00355957A0|nr:2OG-Fe(II) oxygenase superfamily protein [Phytophthora cinnamomi]
MDVRQVPVIDIGALVAIRSDAEVDAALQDINNLRLREITTSVRAAASEWGFFYIANHGLPEQEVQNFQEVMRSFFRLPAEIKRTIRRHATNNRGYVEGELTKNKTDWKECFDFAGAGEDGPATDKLERLGEDQNQWLDESTLPGFRGEMRAYYDKMEHIARRLLKVFAVALGEKPAFFDQFFRSNASSTMRLNHYPVAPEPEKTMGVYHHTDSGALTILLQDDEVASLQVLHRESQTWVDVPPRKGTYTINIGDMVQVWSNDQFVAPLHRVLASSKAGRFSAPFFYSPSYNVQVEPIVVKPGDVPNYRPISWRTFRLARFKGNYADLGQENQIGDYKIHGPIDVANGTAGLEIETLNTSTIR